LVHEQNVFFEDCRKGWENDLSIASMGLTGSEFKQLGLYLIFAGVLKLVNPTGYAADLGYYSRINVTTKRLKDICPRCFF